MRPGSAPRQSVGIELNALLFDWCVVFDGVIIRIMNHRIMTRLSLSDFDFIIRIILFNYSVQKYAYIEANNGTDLLFDSDFIIRIILFVLFELHNANNSVHNSNNADFPLERSAPFRADC